MKMTIAKTIEEMRPVLWHPDSTGPEICYWVFREIEGAWNNITIVAPGDYGGEFTKTVGHYHLNPVNDELYHCISGTGAFILQKKAFDEAGNFVPGKISEVKIVKIKPGDTITISGDYGHALVNIGSEPLITYDDRTAPHSPEDYEAVTTFHGLAYYLINEGGKIKTIANTNYSNLPDCVFEGF